MPDKPTDIVSNKEHPTTDTVRLDTSGFPSHPRFQFVRRLGQGGMGVVFEAIDLERDNLHVALKTLADPATPDADRLRDEFTALAELTHPNLVRLFDCFHDDGCWFYTMELVRGQDLLSYLRDSPDQEFTVEELNAVFSQLVMALDHIHSHYKVHRDIKPSNILVSEAGHVTVLDFGLVSSVDINRRELQSAGELSGQAAVSGTPSYMPLEVLQGEDPIPASDFFSLGVILFEVLTGQQPFPGTGNLLELQRRLLQTPQAEPPKSMGLPFEHWKTCLQLLSPDARRRPSARDLLACFARNAEKTQTRGSLDSFTGRGEQLARLRHVLERVACRESSQIVHISGAPGFGKTTLVRKFLGSIEEEPGVVCLGGRCFPQPGQPYNAFEGFITSLAQYLDSLGARDLKRVLPRYRTELARMFPALDNIRAFRESSERGSEVINAHEIRRRAVAGLREMLGRITDLSTLVVAIDDIDYCDTDSARVLTDVFGHTDSPLSLLLLSYRSQEQHDSGLSEIFACDPMNRIRVDVPVDPLSGQEALQLTYKLFGECDGNTANKVVAQSRGNPFLIQELLQAVIHGEELDVFTLGSVIWRKIARLSVPACRLLVVVAIAGRPIRQRTAIEAAGLTQQNESHFEDLKQSHLIQSRGSDPNDFVEVYHDEVRQAVLRIFTEDELVDSYLRLASSLDIPGQLDRETTAQMYLKGRAKKKAVKGYALAAEKAAQAFAFNRSAELYRLAMETCPEESQRWTISRGDALANAGRGAEAAREYAAASENASVADALELRGKAALQNLYSGQLKQGFQGLSSVLESVGIPWPSGPHAALLGILRKRAWLAVRGLKFHSCDESQVSKEQLTRVDMTWSATIGLTGINTIRGGYYQVSNLLLALQTGEPFRVARALTFEGVHVGIHGAHRFEKATALLDRAEALSKDATVVAYSTLARALLRLFSGQWKLAHDGFHEAERLFRRDCSGENFGQDNAQIYQTLCRWWMGDLDRFRLAIPDLVIEARERRSLSLESVVHAFKSESFLFQDDPDMAAQVIEPFDARWQGAEFCMPMNDLLTARIHTELYRGDAKAAWLSISDKWPSICAAKILYVQLSRIFSRFMYGRCALAASAHDPRLLGIAKRCARRLSREKADHARALSHLLQAGCLERAGKTDRSIAQLQQAEQFAEQAGTQLFMALAQYRQGQLMANPQGDDLTNQADDWMRGQGIVRPDRIANVYAPGFDNPLQQRESQPDA